jgi:hypothetical protein
MLILRRRRWKRRSDGGDFVSNLVQPIPFAGHPLARPRHICAFFENEDEEYRVLLPFIKEGFASGERAVHIVSRERRPRHVDHLILAGIDVAETERSGQLEIHLNAESYLHEGRFDQDRMLNTFESIANGSTGGRYPQSRILCHMDWAGANPSVLPDLIEFEARVNDVWCRHDDTVVCVYDPSKFGAETVVDITRTHPAIIVGGVLHRNPYFVPPAEFLPELSRRRAGQQAARPGPG